MTGLPPRRRRGASSASRAMNTSSSVGVMIWPSKGGTPARAVSARSCCCASSALVAVGSHTCSRSPNTSTCGWPAARRRSRTSRTDGGKPSSHTPGQRGAQRARPVERQQLSVVHQRHARAALGLVEVRGAHQDGDAALEEVREQLPELAPAHRIDAGGGLVEQDQIGLVDQRARQRQLLLHAAGELVGEAAAERRQLGHVEQVVAALLRSRRRRGWRRRTRCSRPR